MVDPDNASIGAALQQVVHSSQQLLADRLTLLCLEGKEAAKQALVEVSCRILAIVLGLAALTLLTVAACLWLGSWLGSPQAVGLVGGFYALMAALLWWLPRGRQALQAAADPEVGP